METKKKLWKRIKELEKQLPEEKAKAKAFPNERQEDVVCGDYCRDCKHGLYIPGSMGFNGTWICKKDIACTFYEGKEDIFDKDGEDEDE